MRRLVGRFCEWALSYEREVLVGFSNLYKAMLPRVGYRDDAGFDLYVSEDTYCVPNRDTEVHTGITISARSPLWFEIKSRSSTLRRWGVEVQDAIIDRGYRGEMFAIVLSHTDHPVFIPEGERICQIVPHLILPCRFRYGELLPSARGRRGFGSSG
jgi:deoxyuridine 5'-triphosphate nucleotidohydrolase